MSFTVLSRIGQFLHHTVQGGTNESYGQVFLTACLIIL